MEIPALLVNFKRYSGLKAIELAETCDDVSKSYRKDAIGIAPYHTDMSSIASRVEIPVFAQYLGTQHSGFDSYVAAERAKEVGARGVLINHSDSLINMNGIEKSVAAAKKYGLISVCCSKDLEESKDIVRFRPDVIAYEPHELIGGTRSVSTVMPHIIEDIVDELAMLSPGTSVYIGAGIRDWEDIKEGLVLGVKGFLVSSVLTEHQNTKGILKEFCDTLYSEGRRHAHPI